ncbi:hypothetical protein [Ruegeria meonggei]|uniref:hypothetical protein n=1 Tax=Ruegeria meonggei TaxID=1446476 RepID=UPI00366E92B7
MPGFDRAFLSGQLPSALCDKPFACTYGASDIFQAHTSVTTAENRLAKDIPAFDNFACTITDLTRRAPHSAATMAPALDRLFLLLTLLVLPHS